MFKDLNLFCYFLSKRWFCMTIMYMVFFNCLILLVDSYRHGDGYVTIIVVNANNILVLPIRSFLSKSTPLYLDFAGNDWPTQQSQGELFA